MSHKVNLVLAKNQAANNGEKKTKCRGYVFQPGTGTI